MLTGSLRSGGERSVFIFLSSSALELELLVENFNSAENLLATGRLLSSLNWSDELSKRKHYIRMLVSLVLTVHASIDTRYQHWWGRGPEVNKFERFPVTLAGRGEGGSLSMRSHVQGAGPYGPLSNQVPCPGGVSLFIFIVKVLHERVQLGKGVIWCSKISSLQKCLSLRRRKGDIWWAVGGKFVIFDIFPTESVVGTTDGRTCHKWRKMSTSVLLEMYIHFMLLGVLNIGYVSNEINTDVRMYTRRIYFYVDVVTLLYMDEVRYWMEFTLVYKFIGWNSNSWDICHLRWSFKSF